MKRFILALPILAATVLFCLPAFAGDAGVLPEPMQTHWIIGVMAVVIPILRTILGKDADKAPTWIAPYRALLVAVLSAASIVIDGLMNGFTMQMAIAAFLANGLPALLQELFKFLFTSKPSDGGAASSGEGASSDGGGQKTAMRPPSPYSTKMVGAVAMACALAIPGCTLSREVKAVTREVASEIIEHADEAARILDILQNVADVFFLARPDAAVQAQVRQYFADARLAAESAVALGKGANVATAGDYNAAFAHFREAYSKLMTVLNDLGVVGKASGGKMSANRRGGGTSEIPVPRAAMAKEVQ